MLKRYGFLLFLVIVAFLMSWLFAKPGTAAVAQTRLRIGWGENLTTLDPHLSTSVAGEHWIPQLFDRLVYFDKDMKIVPQLATSWTVSNNGLTWTFTLRGGQRFHDGTPVDAQAVYESFARLLDPKNRFPRRAQFDAIASFSVVDRYRIAFTAKQPDVFFIYKFADVAASIVSPTAAKKLGQEQFSRQPVGSGPFIFRSWRPGERLIFEKNRDHWLADRGNIDVLEIYQIPDASTRARAMEAGDIDVAIGIDPSDVQRLVGARSNAVAYPVKGLTVRWIEVNTYREPTNNVLLRRALAYAVDQEGLLNLFGGGARLMRSHLASGVWGHSPQRPIEYDPRRARELLAQAGFPNGLPRPLEFLVPVGRTPLAREVGEALGGMFEAIRAPVTIKIVEHNVGGILVSEPPEKNFYQLALRGWTTVTGEPDYGLRFAFHSENWRPKCCNSSFFKNPEYDQLISQAPFTPDERRRAAMYGRAQEILWEYLPAIPLYEETAWNLATPRLTGQRFLPIFALDFREARLLAR